LTRSIVPEIALDCARVLAVIGKLVTRPAAQHVAVDLVVFSGVSATLAEIIDKTAIKSVVSVGLGDGTGTVLASPPVDPRLTGVVTFADALV
jgi:hypothetical protein